MNTSDIANVFGDAYSRSAKAILGDLHDFLFNCIFNFLSALEDQKKRLLVIGPGPQALPFSYYPDKVKAMLGSQGSMVLLDYIYDNNQILNSVVGLTKIRFFEPDMFSPAHLENAGCDIPDGTIAYLKHNMNHRLYFPENSFDCIDATLSLHHVTTDFPAIMLVLENLYKILKPNGLFHWGTADVDMKQPFKKIFDIVQILRENKYQIYLEDERINKILINEIDSVHQPSKPVKLTISNDGMINLICFIPEEKNRLLQLLGNKFNEQIPQNPASIHLTTPIVDASRYEEDQIHLAEVNHFYDQIQEKANNGNLGEDLLRQITEAVEFERHNALRGLVEFYSSLALINHSLEKAGFKDINISKNKIPPFCNITCTK